MGGGGMAACFFADEQPVCPLASITPNHRDKYMRLVVTMVEEWDYPATGRWWAITMKRIKNQPSLISQS